MSTKSNRLREEREKLRISQEEMGAIGGVGRAAQGRYEAGERAPDWEYLERLAQHGVDVHYVITGQRVEAAAALLTAEEAMLVENYRRAAAEGRQAASTVLAALAQQQKK
ncbi:helix-turn-helix domain-containing protein [Azohydromonas lata]|uniref:Helix-turn-helix transcriptional regulator n=1 Tax=Azohydromonas lata TaxID=45677 RepID=A0ABU5IDD7_9BURK|nr:helix-turn-helix transcriptional regulator [Azohydromonas lata]MDZ5456982.1 helix-turn-helix transcriptional regulator [Azohydromonas lata]